MIVHIVGAGPTGMSVAWEILRSTEHQVVIYDKKDTAGGSWWEPKGEQRNLHAPRALFGSAFINAASLFEEMHMKWNDFFQRKENDAYTFLLKTFKPEDILALSALYFKVLFNQEAYKKVTLERALPSFSQKSQDAMSALTRSMDGVTWDIMSAYEFIKSVDYVALSGMDTQRISGRFMGEAMREALERKGATFVFNTELTDLVYTDTTFRANFADHGKVDGELLVLCLDNAQAVKFLGNNWGQDAPSKIIPSTYECITVLFDYDTDITVEDEFVIQMKTEWNILVEVLSDKKTMSCSIMNPSSDILATPPGAIEIEIYRQLQPLGIPEPVVKRMAWGAIWEEDQWTLHQSSGVLNIRGQLPFFGTSKAVAMCGMMSHRSTPYASIEAAVEVGRRFCHEKFGTRPPFSPVLLSQFMIILIVFFIIYRYEI